MLVVMMMCLVVMMICVVVMMICLVVRARGDDDLRSGACSW